MDLQLFMQSGVLYMCLQLFMQSDILYMGCYVLRTPRFFSFKEIWSSSWFLNICERIEWSICLQF